MPKASTRGAGDRRADDAADAPHRREGGAAGDEVGPVEIVAEHGERHRVDGESGVPSTSNTGQIEPARTDQTIARKDAVTTAARAITPCATTCRRAARPESAAAHCR